MWRAALLACAGLSACVAVPREAPVNVQELRGCWIEHRDKGAVTFRWFEDRDQPRVWAGEQIDYFIRGEQVDSVSWRLSLRVAPARLCRLDASGASSRCWTLSGARPSAVIAAAPETLRIEIDASTLFNGARDGCD